MPSEHRFLIFNDGEVVRAVSEYRKRQRTPLPAGTVVKTRYFTDPEVELMIRIGADDGSRRIDVMIGAEELQAAVVFFCIQRKIPLPAAKFVKNIKVVDQQLMLAITNEVAKRNDVFKQQVQSAGHAGDASDYDVNIRPSGAVLLKHGS